MPTLRKLIEQAVKLKGSQAKLAAAVGCSQQQIAYLLRAKSISVVMAKRVDEATGGAVSKHDLRPDFFGAPKPMRAASKTEAA